MLHTLNLYSVIYQIYLNFKDKEKKTKQKWF